MKRYSNRMIRINEEIKRELSYIIANEIKDPRVDKLLTLVKVETTSDLKYCKVYVSSLSDHDKKLDTINGLKNAEGYIRRELARKLNLRNTPEIKFVLDDSIEYSINMSKLLKDIHVDNKDDLENE